MATTSQGKVSSVFALTYKDSDAAFSDREVGVSRQHSQTFAQGSGNNQINIAYHRDRIGLGLSTTDTYELDDASLKSAASFGVGVTFTNLKIIRVTHKVGSLAVTGIKIKGDFWTTRFGASGEVILEPGAEDYKMSPLAGYLIVASTGDTLEIENLDSSFVADYFLDLVGIGS